MSVCSNFFRYVSAKYYLNWFTFGEVITKIKRVDFLLRHSVDMTLCALRTHTMTIQTFVDIFSESWARKGRQMDGRTDAIRKTAFYKISCITTRYNDYHGINRVRCTLIYDSNRYYFALVRSEERMIGVQGLSAARACVSVTDSFSFEKQRTEVDKNAVCNMIHVD